MPPGLSRLSAALQARGEAIADLISSQMGSPKSWSIMGQVFSSTMVLDTYAALAADYTWVDERPGALGGRLQVRRAPVGVAAGIIPWNVPLFIIALKLGPAMAAGVPIVLKPAPETPLDSYLFAEAVLEADLPPGIINIVPAGRENADYLVRHPGIDKVSFTGSTAVGKHIASVCGEQLKRVTLELGGKSAAIVLDDVVLDDTLLNEMVMSGLMNNGQVCGAQSRILAPQSRYNEVVDALADKVGALVVGDPLDPATQIGPLVAKRQQERVEGFLEAGKSAGARAVTGGEKTDQESGWYITPTVFADVDNNMKIAREEIFGPVLSVIPYSDEANAISIANDTDYGLCGSVWTADVDARRRGRGQGADGHGGDQLVDDPRLQRPVRRVQAVGPRPRARTGGHRALHRAPDGHPSRGLTLGARPSRTASGRGADLHPPPNLCPTGSGAAW